MASTLAVLSALSAGRSISERPNGTAGRGVRGYPHDIPKVATTLASGKVVLVWFNPIVHKSYCIAPLVMYAMGDDHIMGLDRPRKARPV